MTFDSIAFAIFLPIVFVLYWTIGHSLKHKNLILLISSYLFYGWWDWRFLVLLLLTTTSSYYSARQIEKSLAADDYHRARCYNFANILLNLTVLGCFKYYDFFVQSFNEIMSLVGLSTDWPLLHLILPMGISFYTFQALSYTIDVYRRQVNAERDWFTFAAYLSFFPQLVAGPIERAGHLLSQFHREHSFDYDATVKGCRQMLWGFVKKIVIADNCAVVIEQIFSNVETAGGSAILYGAVLFAFQIYADFSGYSDIAIGTARLFGFSLSPNFDNPYFAESIPDFWRRWHISLTSWFRDYVYIPLGGSRCSRLRTFMNTLIVFSLSGLWHGANWTFVAWGFYHGILFFPWNMGWIRNKSLSNEKSIVERFFSIFVTFFLVTMGWIIFRSESIDIAISSFERIFCHPDLSFMQYSKSILLLIAFVFFAESKNLMLPNRSWQRWIVYYILIFIMLWKSTSSSQFIYFQF